MTRLHDFDYRMQLTAEHPILTDHRVHGERILPGVTFIDMILQVLTGENIALDTIQLERMLFRTPICLAPGQACDLRVHFVESEARIYVETYARNEWVEHCRCNVTWGSFPHIETHDIHALKAHAKTQKNLNVVYDKAKRLSIHHGPYMQGEGVAYVGDDYVLAEIQLSDIAAPSAVDHIAHPALMDSATVVPFAAGIMGMDSNNPFIPIAIESFNLRAPLNNRVFVFAKISVDGKADSDVLHNDILLLAENGDVIGRFLRLTAKCIRSVQAITGLQAAPAVTTELSNAAEQSAPQYVANEQAGIEWVKQLVATKLSVSTVDLDINKGFYELGLDSTALLDLVAHMERELSCALYPTLLFEHNTIAALSNYLHENTIVVKAPVVESKNDVAPRVSKTLFTKVVANNLQDETPSSVNSAPVSLIGFISQIIAETLNSDVANLNVHTGFYELGLDSNQLLSLSSRLEKEFNTSLYPTLLFECNTIHLLADYFSEQKLLPLALTNTTTVAPAIDSTPEPDFLAVQNTVADESCAWHSAWQSKPLTIQPSKPSSWLLVGDMRNSKSFELLLQTKGTVYYCKDELTIDDAEVVQRFSEQLTTCLEDEHFAGVVWLVPEADHQQHVQTALFIAQALAKTGKPLAIFALAKERNIAAAALAGFWRSLRHELSRVHVRQIMSQALAAYQWHAEFSALPTGFELVRYQHGQREVEQLELMYLPVEPHGLTSTHEAAVVISGGFGGIAVHVLRHLIAQGWKQFALLGRRLPNDTLAQELEQWREKGIEILAIAADVSDKNDVTKAWAKIKNRFTQVKGIIHSAGVLRDSLVKDKTAEQLRDVLAAKVIGAQLLDKVSAQEALDFFVCFGSISGVLGNLGQSDYAYANAALAALCAERQQKVNQQERTGRSVTIHWPLWRDGGMALSVERSEQLAALTGLQQIENAQALAAFDALVFTADLSHTAYLPVVGDMQRFSTHLQHLGLFTPLAERVVNAPVNHHANEAEKVIHTGNTSETKTITAKHHATYNDEPIAIIGLAGVYPAAHSIDAFWHNLTAGVDAISDIPTSRWDNAALFDEARGTAGKVYSRWGGFIEHADHFDAEFFGITPKEAELMDPQERLFLQVAWHTLEDAGLPASRLNKEAVGVFVGAMWGQYQMLGLADATAKQTASMFSAIANRVSYTLNLTGPSLAIDTMCSSTLSALHLAVESIHRGDCAMALVGGVNVMSHAHKYQFLCQNQMLSDDGKCRSFGEGGSGYVPGEGVGAVLLKPLSQAERDGDNIHAVIRGSALNHGGRAAGMTVPNPSAQANVIRIALQNAKLEPARVSVIEAHGTGTLLGDPIELVGLKKVFGESTTAMSIGSVKSNIGHLESAAGIAALSKVVLQLKHKKLVPSLHSQQLNPKLRFDGTPFTIQQTLEPWQSAQSRIAGISAFGAGGSNAHVIVEEYTAASAEDDSSEVVIPISARTPEALVRYVGEWINYLQGASALAPNVPLVDVANSAQVGRDAMSQRLALVCRSRDEAIAQLNAYLQGKYTRGLFGCSQDVAPVTEQERLAAAFVSGAHVDWPVRSLRRVSVPVYPFAPSSYWYPQTSAVHLHMAQAVNSHPLLQRVIPSMEGARFAADLTQKATLIAQHSINGKTLLPAAAMLTMMVDGALKLGIQKPLHIDQLTLARAVNVGAEGVQLRTCFYPATADGSALLAEVLSGKVDEKVHAQARIGASDAVLADAVSIPQVWQDASELYRQFAARGFAYGPAFQQITEFARVGDTQVWAALGKTTGTETVTQSVLVIDAAMQASVLLQGDIAQDKQAFLPYQLADVDYSGDLAQAAYIHVNALSTTASERVFALSTFNADGKCVWRCARFSLRLAVMATAPATQVSATAPAVVSEGAANPHNKSAVTNAIATHLAQLLATHTGLDKQVIAKANSFDQVGIDSVVIMAVTRELEVIAGQLPKTLFFECPSVALLADYLWDNHANAFASSLLKTLSGGVAPAPHRPVVQQVTAEPIPNLKSFATQFKAVVSAQEPLAIVGLSGRYPDADNIDQLWDNLKQGRDSVIPVPAHRWDVEQYFHPDKFNKHTTYCRHGGFIDKAECFDPSFFNMTPADALLADPQERIFLQAAWHALEDAGYARRSISGKSVGVFAAVMWNQYQMYGLNKAMVGEQAGAYSVASALANRVSYTMNIKGPSLTLDTMCSSSLTALHLAARAIWNGDCQSAFVGGVNLSLHPHKYVSLCTSNFLSANGRCSAFGADADGYVPAEGVGVVYIKPLSQAEADGDHIYGVIRATAINHVGTTNGATVPSPDSQADLIRQACRQAAIEPNSINYIEAHGTGTSLGDPIEVRGLEKALNAERNHPGCAIGSIKSNIGHPESAAGIASLTKVLLQLQHGQLAPSLHATPLNPNIDFANTPFRVNQNLCDWPRVAEATPLRAGIHSFGAGGSNAHVIVEEYLDTRAPSLQLDDGLVVLSARTLDQLKAAAAQLQLWVQRNPNLSLTEFCYTLQVGREAFDHRFVAPVNSLEQVQNVLQALVEGSPERAGGSYYRVTAADDMGDMLANDEGKVYVNTLLSNQRWEGVGRLWVRGVEVDWSQCYAGFVRRLRLPGYVFAEEKLLLPLDEAAIFAGQAAANRRVHLQNLSDLYGQRYRSELHNRHAFLSHHQIDGRKIVPMAWLASLALATAQQSASDEIWEIAHFALTQPLLVGDKPLTLDLVVEPASRNGLQVTLFEINGEHEREVASVTLQSRSQWVEISTAELASVPVETSESFYAEFAASGFNYGTSYRQVARFAANPHQLIAELNTTPAPWVDVAHPGVIDAALQLTRKLTADDGRQWLPQAMRGFWFEAGIQATNVIVERLQDSGDQLEFRLYWCDAAQTIVGYCASFKLAQVRTSNVAATSGDLMLLGHHWVACPQVVEVPSSAAPVWIIEPNGHWLSEADVANATVIRWSEDNRIEQPNLWLATPDTAGMAALAARAKGESLRILVGDSAEFSQDQTAFWCLWHLVRELVGNNLNRLELVVVSRAPNVNVQALYSWMHALAEERPSYQMRLVQSAVPRTVNDWFHALAQNTKFSRFNAAGEFEVYGVSSPSLVEDKAHLTGQTVLITGGAGGLGRVFSCHLAQTHGCNLVLTGRKSANDDIKAFLAELRQFNVEAAYFAADIGNSDSMALLTRKIAQRFGGLDGVIHAAGVSNDDYILRQQADSIAQVLQPKVQGTEQLLQALTDLGCTTADQPWMVGFSSISGFFGNAGQADYSFANAVMDAHLQSTASPVRTLSINWPLWDGVGMQLSDDMVRMMHKATGMSPLPVAVGLDLFDQALASNLQQLLPLYGSRTQLHGWVSSLAVGLAPLTEQASAHVQAQAPAVSSPVQQGKPLASIAMLKAPVATSKGVVAAVPTLNIRDLLADVVAAETGIAAGTLDWQKGIDQYGFSSVVVSAMTASLQKTLGELPKTLFFECRTLGEMAQYLEQHHAPSTAAPVSASTSSSVVPAVAQVAPTEFVRQLVATVVADENGMTQASIDWERGLDSYGFSSVAVSAMTANLQKTLGDLPKTLFFECRNLQELVAYLAANHAPASVVTAQPVATAAPIFAAPTNMVAKAKRGFRFARSQDEVAIVGAAGRFPQAENLHAFWSNLVAGRDSVTGVPAGRWTTGDAIPAYAKGGFIDNIDQFDARFFGINHQEAAAADPQERLFLQTAWHSLEDAGIAPSRLAGRKVGVYVGAMWGQYQLQGLDAWRNGTGGATVSSFASIANRVSYFFDFKGPSVALDSMCSSALVALKMALDALNNGEIDYALVGGVNTSVHAYKYKQLQDSMFLSKAGCCKAFGADGDGYVPGEGVACLVLTRSSEAEQHGIRKRALVKGMAVAHGGNGNGYYVPNPHEQAEVIQQALENAQIAPETISYVEAHGTGTALGDPIEVRGLQKSYFANSKFPCAIGSVKANIGHLEAAAGMASICKVLMQMEHDQLVPSIHSTPQNPNIDFASTGLQVQHELASWAAVAGDRPRRAGISSFGAGGTNVHLILEAAPELDTHADQHQTNLFVLSAKDQAALKRHVQNTLNWLPEQHGSLADIAAASQRRQAFDYRLAFVVDSLAALNDALVAWLKQPEVAKVSSSQHAHQVPANTSKDQLHILAKHWLAGDSLINEQATHAALPLYPFAPDRHWLDAVRSTNASPIGAQASQTIASASMVAQAGEDQIIAIVAKQLGYAADDIDLEADFNSLGLDSVQASEIASTLSRVFNAEILPTAFYNYPNLGAFSHHIAAQHTAIDPTAVVAESIVATKTEQQDTAIAIIGMSGAFAEADNVEAFWHNLKNGKNSVLEVPESRWSLADYYDATPGTAGKTYSKRMGLLNDIGEFDPAFFGLLPEEVFTMDPQQRLFLKHSYLALEDAGISREQLDGSKTGIFAGAMTTSYRQLLPEDQTYSAFSMIGNHNAALPARLAYWLNLKGPSLVVDTACSSSLMALHLACNSLQSGDSNIALAGGVFVTPGPQEQVASSAAGMLSPDGQCKTFSDEANGIAIGEGVGIVVLKTLAQAQADGDPIYAVIRASGVNQDGKTNGITAPNALSQGELVESVLRKAKLNANDVQYIETHGTGTKLGDPVEIEGLKIALGNAQHPILLGSVKPNIGHCYAAAGVASLMKAVLAIKHAELPPSIHAESLNRLIPFANLPFAVNHTLQAWPSCTTRRAGVSAFGYTGTNVHVLLEQAPAITPHTARTELPLLLPLSARKAKALCVQAQKLADYLIQHPHTDMREFAYTLQVGRSAQDYRQCFLVADRHDAIAQLTALSQADEKSLQRVKRRSEQPKASDGDQCVARASWMELITLWQNGMSWNWAMQYNGKLSRLNLPGSEFDNKTYWPETKTIAEQSITLIQSSVDVLPMKLKAVNRAEFKNIA